ncbi:MAG TPA: hypothetical protein VLT82_07760 [Myxococcaceae bacterium]|nr:hypothetical protein [Myxococcaceae bacterium]
MHRWVVVCAAVIVAACDQYTEPPPPRDVQPLSTRGQEMAWAGIDYAGTGHGRDQRNGTGGINSDMNDTQEMEVDREDDPGPPAGSGSFGLAITESAPGRGSTAPAADLDQPELRNAQRGGRVFRPSDHYFINGVDQGPSWDAAPGTGGPNKAKVKQP